MSGIISVMTQSLILSIMALGVYITYKILDFPDMSADGSYTMGASIVAFSLTNGISPVVATLMAILCGCTAGLVTGILHIKFKISNLLSGILVMGMLYSINLRIMGKSNIPLFSFKHLFNGEISPIVLALAFVFICKVLLDLFLKTGLGYTLKGVGDNSQMIKSGLIALSGSLMAQFLGFSDVNMGIGTLVLGIASIIIGITLFKKFTFIKDTTAIIVGSFIYQFTIYFAMSLGMLSTDLKLITAIVIIAFLATGNLNISLKKNKCKASTKNKSEKRGVVDVTN
ncbi:ABC transporter permease [Clostridioides difficile]|nr:ABC transporter permease [Clostridioides difficile]SJV18705.1 ABC transporter permease [Clostridioides difficile]SJV21466.1 ABC transporter permease [Clostridioides difficile]SJV65018.1 ABC transporter permease [Clostridioides difficile]SJX14109.1 ABC transporter permease [Clostridioides difficile]VFG21404.1 ABC transporter sugar-family permease [Clostridioides difficile]